MHPYRIQAGGGRRERGREGGMLWSRWVFRREVEMRVGEKTSRISFHLCREYWEQPRRGRTIFKKFPAQSACLPRPVVPCRGGEKCWACSCLSGGPWLDCAFLSTVSLGLDRTESQAYFPCRRAFSLEPKETLKFISFDLSIVKMETPRSREEVSARCVNPARKFSSCLCPGGYVTPCGHTFHKG